MKADNALAAAYDGAAIFHAASLGLLLLGGGGAAIALLVPKAGVWIVPSLVALGAGGLGAHTSSRMQINIAQEMKRLREGQDAQLQDRPPPVDSIRGHAAPDTTQLSRPAFGCFW